MFIRDWNFFCVYINYLLFNQKREKINEICISKLREKESSISLNGHIPVVYTAKNSEGPPREGASGVVTGPVPQETTGVVQQQTHEERDVPDRQREQTVRNQQVFLHSLRIYNIMYILKRTVRNQSWHRSVHTYHIKWPMISS